MLRVPGTRGSLLAAKADGADVRVVYSPLDAIRTALANPDREVIFFAIGFETTAPANAAATLQARHLGLANFSLLVAQVLVPPAIAAILAAPDCRVDGLLAAGHVCTVMGYSQYEELADRYRTPIIVTGFEPLDILQGVHMLVTKLEAGIAGVGNQYSRVVQRRGNETAQRLMSEVFQVVDANWRGFGVIPDSGLALREGYREFDAAYRFGLKDRTTTTDPRCIATLILQGKRKPSDCAAFGYTCTPEHPLGAPMVSAEGACAAYYRYREPQSASPITGGRKQDEQ
jgi:hydrogenase expression/formation protein HypD